MAYILSKGKHKDWGNTSTNANKFVYRPHHNSFFLIYGTKYKSACQIKLLYSNACKILTEFESQK